MSHPIPEDVQRLTSRLRLLADELESAARYGVPVDPYISADGHEHGDVSMSLTAEQFDAWADYTEATVVEYDHNGRHWRRATVDVNGLPLRFAADCGPASVRVSA